MVGAKDWVVGVKREMKVLFMSSTKGKGSISLKRTRGREKEKEKRLGRTADVLGKELMSGRRFGVSPEGTEGEEISECEIG